MTLKIIKHHYTECGLPNVWIMGLAAKDDQQERAIRIPSIRSLHQLISKMVLSSDGTLTGLELRYLRTEMGLTQTQLGELVHRKRLTIARWENEESKLDGATEAYIRILASKKLGLGEVDPEEVIGKCTQTSVNKVPIQVTVTASGNYRLAA